MKNLKLLLTDEDTWNIAEGENDGTPFTLRFRPHLKDFIHSQHYKKHLVISWSYESDNSSLMPSEEQIELMENIENSLIENLESELQAVLTFIFTGQNRRDWHWYSKDIAETGELLNNALVDFEKLPIEITAEDDENWSEYLAVIDGAED